MERCAAFSIVVLLLGASIGQRNEARDGDWWLALDVDQRTQVMAGYFDYYVYERKGTVPFGGSFMSYERLVSERLRQNPFERERPVVKTLELLASGDKASVDRLGRHGSFDGDYWRQAFASERLGFVQGLLEGVRHDPKPRAKFSKTFTWYVAQISAWYGVKDGVPEVITTRRAGDKIYDVLCRFKD